MAQRTHGGYSPTPLCLPPHCTSLLITAAAAAVEVIDLSTDFNTASLTSLGAATIAAMASAAFPQTQAMLRLSMEQRYCCRLNVHETTWVLPLPFKSGLPQSHR